MPLLPPKLLQGIHLHVVQVFLGISNEKSEKALLVFVIASQDSQIGSLDFQSTRY